MNSVDLDKLKKRYGESFAKLCRQLFPTILVEEGKLYEIISKFFIPSRSLFEDINASISIREDFKNFVYTQYTSKEEVQKTVSARSPYELMKEAGYTLYKCETNEDVLSFKKYWKDNEALCTFRDPNRINSHIIYFAVRDDVDTIRREDFEHPLRQDQYGTSVISIQFSKGKVNTISIKNRYNHSVNNPDATFSNDLENICAGLTESFVEESDLNLVADVAGFEIPGYITDHNGRYYKYNLEIDNVYYCENNVVIGQDRVAHQYDKSRYELIEQFLLDKVDKTIVNLSESEDSFTTLIQNIQKIEINKSGENRQIDITTTAGEQKILVNKNNAIIGYENSNAITIGDNFLSRNRKLTEISIPNVRTIGEGFIYCNKQLHEINLPNVTTIGDYFLQNNEQLHEINLPNVTIIGGWFLSQNRDLTEISFPNVTTIGNDFIFFNEQLHEISIPNVRTIGDGFLYCNKQLHEINLPNVTIIGGWFLSQNRDLTEISFPNVRTIGEGFINCNKQLHEINLPNVRTIGDYFLQNNERLHEISLPNVRTIGDWFLHYNEQLHEISIPNVRTIGDGFLISNARLTEIILPNDTTVGEDFLKHHKRLTKINMPEGTKLDADFLF